MKEKTINGKKYFSDEENGIEIIKVVDGDPLKKTEYEFIDFIELFTKKEQNDIVEGKRNFPAIELILIKLQNMHIISLNDEKVKNYINQFLEYEIITEKRHSELLS